MSFGECQLRSADMPQSWHPAVVTWFSPAHSTPVSKIWYGEGGSSEVIDTRKELPDSIAFGCDILLFERIKACIKKITEVTLYCVFPHSLDQRLFGSPEFTASYSATSACPLHHSLFNRYNRWYLVPANDCKTFFSVLSKMQKESPEILVPQKVFQQLFVTLKNRGYMSSETQQLAEAILTTLSLEEKRLEEKGKTIVS